MFKSLLVVAICGFAAASALGGSGLLGSDPCTQGPAYWCQSLTSAAQCSAVSNCQKNGQLGSAGNVECELCQYAITAVDNYLSQNATDTKIIDELEKVCSILPSGDQAACKAFIDSEGPALIQYIVQQLDPKTVCTDIKACTSAKLAMAKAAAQKTVLKFRRALPVKGSPSNDECSTCKAVVSAVDAALETNSTQTAIINEIEKICADLGPLASACENWVQTEGPTLIDDLAQKLDPTTVCTDLKLCSTVPSLSEVNPLLGGEKCTYGPSYWCTSKDTATACNQLDFCLKKWAQ
jgi:saposin